MKEILIGILGLIVLCFILLEVIAYKGQSSIDEYWDEQKRKGGI